MAAILLLDAAVVAPAILSQDGRGDGATNAGTETGACGVTDWSSRLVSFRLVSSLPFSLSHSLSHTSARTHAQHTTHKHTALPTSPMVWLREGLVFLFPSDLFVDVLMIDFGDSLSDVMWVM